MAYIRGLTVFESTPLVIIGWGNDLFHIQHQALKAYHQLGTAEYTLKKFCLKFQDSQEYMSFHLDVYLRVRLM